MAFIGAFPAENQQVSRHCERMKLRVHAKRKG